MYHIPHDKRALSSAELLYQGLIDSLQEKALVEVTVMDVIRKSQVSRATFYRLFDTVIDILIWKCEQILKDAMSRVSQTEDHSSRHIFIFFISAWIDNRDMLSALIDNARVDILYTVHMQYMDEIIALFLPLDQFDPIQKEYLAGLLASILPAVFQVWIKHPQYQSEEVFEQLRNSLGLLKSLFDEKELSHLG